MTAFGPLPFTLRQLQYVVAVADELSFRRAAARCHVSQPSLSSQLGEVEDALGVRLFERGRSRVLVTGAGAALIERARRVLLAAEDLVLTGQRAADPTVGTLAIGVIPTVSPYLLPAIAPALRARYPRLRLQWREAKTEELERALAAGELDAIIVALEAQAPREPGPARELERIALATDPFVVAVRADHPLGRGRGPVPAGELRASEVLLLDDGHCFRDQALEVCSTARAREADFRATSLTTLVQMVAGGTGITLLPTLAVATEAARAGLRVRPLAGAGAHRTITLAWRRQAPLAPTLRDVAAVMREAFPSGNPRSGPPSARKAGLRAR